jgi:cell division protein FtsI (penicillin-binding protein 3)
MTNRHSDHDLGIRGLARPRAPAGSERRARVIAGVFVGGATLGLGVLLVRVAQLQLAPSEALAAHMSPRVSQRDDAPLRGDILDRRGRLLATTRFARRVILDPEVFLAQKDADQATSRLAIAMGMPESDLRSRLRDASELNAVRAQTSEQWPTLTESQKRSALGLDAKSTASATQAWPGSPASPSAPQAAQIAQSARSTDPVPALGENDPFAVSKDDLAELGTRSEQRTSDSGAPSGDASTRGSGGASSDEALAPPKPIRYWPVGELLSTSQEQAVRDLLSPRKNKSDPPRIAGLTLERVPVREPVAGDVAAAIVGSVGFGDKGTSGTEFRREDDLSGDAGSIAYVRDRSGKPLWIEPGFIVPAKSGSSIQLSLDLELQRIAHEELAHQVETMNAAGGRLVMIDPQSGELLAMVDIIRSVPDALPVPWVAVDAKGKPLEESPAFDASRRYVAIQPDPGRLIHPALGRNRCVIDIYEPGSTFKPFVWATITELGLARPTEVFDTEGGRWRAPDGRPLTDVVERDRQSWVEVLVNSSNIGMVKAAQRLSHKQTHDMATRFGFGARTNVGLPGEAKGLVTPLANWKGYTQVSVAYGHEIAVSPLQMVRAFSAFCRTGPRAGTLPQLRLLAVEGDESAPVTFRVLPPSVAQLTRETMVPVVESVERRWMKDEIPEGGWRYRLFGKSGTALIPLSPPPGHRSPKGAGGYLGNQFISSFIAAGPVEEPRLVCVAIIDDPWGQSNRKARYGSSAAGPVTRRVLERSLTYLGVPASPREQPPSPDP